MPKLIKEPGDEFQHHVPQFYLKNFCIEKQVKLHYYKFFEKQPEYTVIGEIAGDINYYCKFSADGDKDDTLDKEIIQKTETNAGRAYKDIIHDLNNQTKPSIDFRISKTHKEALAKYLFWQHKRAPALIEKTKRDWKADVDKIIAEHPDIPSDHPLKANYDNEIHNLALNTTQVAGSDGVMEKAMLLKKWHFYIIKDSPFRFITTDNPFFKENRIKQQFSIFDHGTAMQFPIAHNIYLLLGHYGDAGDQNTVQFVKKDDDIITTNNQLATFAVRYLISPNMESMEKLDRYQNFMTHDYGITPE